MGNTDLPEGVMDTLTENEVFRSEFRATVPENYSGVRHGLFILGFGVFALAVCGYFIQPPVAPADWLMVLLVVVGWNLAEWYGHRYLHRPGNSALSRALYKRHTLTHHRFFTQDNGTLRDAQDLKIVFFPAFALPAITVMALVPGALAWLILSLNAGLLIVMTAVAMYMLFEFFHLCAHLPETSRLTRLPLVSTMRRHHLAHHDPAIMMKMNMNFTLPWADWYFDTSDVKRGFWGTTFNGSSTRYVRRRK
jgi:hypothetical protein